MKKPEKKPVQKRVPPADQKEIFTPYITIKGQRVWHPTGGVFHFFVKA